MKKDFGIAIVNSTIELMAMMVQNTLHFGPELIYVTSRVFFRYDGDYDHQVSNAGLERTAIGAVKVRTYVVSIDLYCVDISITEHHDNLRFIYLFNFTFIQFSLSLSLSI